MLINGNTGLRWLIRLALTAALLLPDYVAANGKAPRIKEHPSDVTVQRNEPVQLKCSADGIPPPVIEWYRDGEFIIGSSSSASSSSSAAATSRILLPDGALFFLRVAHGRKENDSGVYWCLARNSHGVARSRNATLTVAHLQTEFRAVPQPVQGIAGGSVVMECQAPRGHPEPQIRWKKNGQPLELDLDLGVDSDRIRVEESGNLVITKLAASDQGQYTCVAQNIVAIRETSPSLLTVNVPPGVIRPPHDATALIGSDVSFECGATGEPFPTVTWRRLDGSPMPPNARIRPDFNKHGSFSTLRVERISASDSGLYQCNVENAVGFSSATVQLTVLVPPTWDGGNSSSVTGTGSTPPSNSPLPKETRTHAGHTVRLDCPANGSPKPLIFWSREGRSELLFAGAAVYRGAESRWSVLDNGTLVIRDVRREDASVLWCSAVNDAGSLFARTRLDVASVSMPPPVVIEVGPANQTLPTKSPASLPCQAEGQPVKWAKNGERVNAVQASGVTGNLSGQQGSSRPRISVSDSGMLTIEDLHTTDSGTYTCEVGDDDQFAAWTATLAVANPTNPNVVFFRSPSDPMALPGSPSQPRLLHRTTTSLTISWQSGSRMGASPLLGYIIEVFSSAEDDDVSDHTHPRPGSWTWSGPTVSVKRAWRIVTRGLKADQFTLHELQPATSYTFLVRAENSHGLSLPSPVSPWFTTLPTMRHNERIQWQSAAEIEETRQRLSAPLLRLENARSVNSTSVRLSWLFLDSDSNLSLDGVHVWYRQQEPVATAEDNSRGEELFFPLNRAPSGYFMVGSLMPYTRYIFFLVPSFRGIAGQPSNSKVERTMESVPAAPPSNLAVRQLNASSVLVQWLPPPSALRNGNITAYQISVALDGTNPRTILANLTIPAIPTSVVIGGLMIDTAYSIQAAAWTLMGLGPTSNPVVHRMDTIISTSTNQFESPIAKQPSGNENLASGSDSAPQGVTQVVQEMWFILLLGSILLAILCLLVAALIVRRNLAKKKALLALSKNGLYIDTNCAGGNTAGSVRGRDPFCSRGWSTSIGHAKELDVQATLLPHGDGTTAVVNRPLDAQPEYAELLRHNAHHDQGMQQQQQIYSHHYHPGQLSLSSFLPRRNVNVQQPHPEAYATTTLVTHRSNGASSNQSQSYGNHDQFNASCSVFASDSSGYTTDELGDLSRPGFPHSGKVTKSRRSNNSNALKILPNLGEILPPPPRHPPPSSPSLDASDQHEPVSSSLKLKNGPLPLPTHTSPALCKKNGLSNHATTAIGKATVPARRSSTSPLASGGSQQSASSSNSPPYPSDHYQVIAGSSPSENEETSDADSHEYAYAYHNPMENLKYGGIPYPGLDQHISFSRHNGYLQSFNSHHDSCSTKRSGGKGSFDPQHPLSLTSHLLPNTTCLVDRAVTVQSSLDVQTSETPRSRPQEFSTHHQA